MCNRKLVSRILSKQSRIARLEWHLKRRDFLSFAARRKVERQIEMLRKEIR